MTKVTVPVTQKDREAAAPFTWGAFGTHVVDGECDDLPCPQAFAAHRIAADLAGYERGQRETVERIVAWLHRSGNCVANISIPRMETDNLAILLCSHFDNPDQDAEDDTGWTPDGVSGYEETIAAITAFFADAIEAGEWK